MPARFVTWVLLALAAPAAPATTEIQIHFSAISRLLAEQVFTQEGRKYVKGSKTTRCSFAYMEHPEISGGGGRILIKAHFSGRSAAKFFGGCVGLGDSFDVWIGAVPYYQDGSMRLRDVRVESREKDGIYIRRVRAALADSLSKEFAYRIGDDAKRILESRPEKATYSQQLVRFHVAEIRVTPESLVLEVEFAVAVR